MFYQQNQSTYLAVRYMGTVPQLFGTMKCQHNLVGIAVFLEKEYETNESHYRRDWS